MLLKAIEGNDGANFEEGKEEKIGRGGRKTD